MFEALISFDRNLFLAINGSNSHFMDVMLGTFADRFIWIPMYILIAFLLYRKFGNQAFFMILFAGVLVLLSDQGSVFVKDMFQRFRPCYDPSIALMVHNVGPCGGQYGFVSSHAANTMALFTYILLLTRNSNRWLTLSLAVWVIITGYCRVYLGKHFPADVAGGWLVGIIAAMITYLIYRSLFASPNFHLKKNQ